MGAVRVSRKELDSQEAVERLDRGDRVIVELEALGRTRDVVLRKSAGEYRCDTGVKLFTYEEREDMRRCIERPRLTERT